MNICGDRNKLGQEKKDNIKILKGLNLDEIFRELEVFYPNRACSDIIIIWFSVFWMFPPVLPRSIYSWKLLV
jgi:hypothetical protein